MPAASIIVPAFNVARTIGATMDALLAQTFDDFEIIVVDDGSRDTTADILERYVSNPKVTIIMQRNRGLAGARNTRINAAMGEFVGFCDADDLWLPEKLQQHVCHLRSKPDVGISFCGSELIDDNGAPLGMFQRPRLKGLTATHIFKRNPIGNGSAPVIRKQVFAAIAYSPRSEGLRDWYFDETFRQSEDIECWLRIALTTDWKFEGIPGYLTQYRINAGGLSAATDDQLAAWERMVGKLTPLCPDFFAWEGPAARAYQLRYLARRAISDKDTTRAMALLRASVRQSWRPFWEEPRKTAMTAAAVALLALAGPLVIDVLMGTWGKKA